MTKRKEIKSAELYRRLSKALGISREAVKDLQRGYKEVYLECIKNGEGFTLPGIGEIKIEPYQDSMVWSVFEGKMVPRVLKYKIMYCESKPAKRNRRLIK